MLEYIQDHQAQITFITCLAIAILFLVVFRGNVGKRRENADLNEKKPAPYGSSLKRNGATENQAA